MLSVPDLIRQDNLQDQQYKGQGFLTMQCEVTMKARAFLFIIILLFCGALSAVLNPATMLTGVPSCLAFAGDAAMKTAGGVTHLTYLHSPDNQEYSIIYLRLNADNTIEHHMVDTFTAGFNPQFTENYSPTLELAGNAVYIFYSRDGEVKKALSTDNGNSFAISVLEEANDVKPLVGQHEGNWSAFYTPWDICEDGSYQSFSNQEMSTNNTILNYWGPDVISGPVRANSDIWIKQAGGGANNGWPTFLGPVYTSGSIQSFTGTPPYAQVFQGGYHENVPELKPDFEGMSWQALQSGVIIGSQVPTENRIMLVRVTGATYTSWIGQITSGPDETLGVYSTYPPAEGTHLFDNSVPQVDTLWTPGPTGNSANQVMVVNCPLWISGTFSGRQTWYSPYDIMINGNILLFNTLQGEPPLADSDDYVALVSEKRILVQYGYKNPADSVRYHPNCRTDMEGVYIYASLYAMKPDPSGNPRQDGHFSFEYQHPHGSVPDVNIGGAIYDKIDLHRRRYPQTAENPWPGNIDYPWYNPLWPERTPYMERGTIRLFGSLYQQRRGFIHRNITDSEYPNPTGLWDIENDLCGSTSGTPVVDPVLGFTMQGINYPGASGSGVGYKKNYQYDSRLSIDTFPFNPFGLGMRFKQSADGISYGYRFYKVLNEQTLRKGMTSRSGRTAFHLNNHLAWQPSINAEPSELETAFNADEALEQIAFTLDNDLMMRIHKDNGAAPDSLRLVKLNPVAGTLQEVFSIPVISRVNTMFDWLGAYTCFANLETNGRIRFYFPDNDGVLQSWNLWNPQIEDLQLYWYNPDKSSIHVLFVDTDTVFVLLNLVPQTGVGSTLYYAKGVLEYTSVPPEPETPLAVRVVAYPNPFSEKLTFKLELSRETAAGIAVYNVRGQKVKTLCQNAVLKRGENLLEWDGKDEQGRQASNGIYFVRSNISQETRNQKVLLLK